MHSVVGLHGAGKLGGSRVPHPVHRRISLAPNGFLKLNNKRRLMLFRNILFKILHTYYLTKTRYFTVSWSPAILYEAACFYRRPFVFKSICTSASQNLKTTDKKSTWLGRNMCWKIFVTFDLDLWLLTLRAILYFNLRHHVWEINSPRSKHFKCSSHLSEWTGDFTSCLFPVTFW